MTEDELMEIHKKGGDRFLYLHELIWNSPESVDQKKFYLIDPDTGKEVTKDDLGRLSALSKSKKCPDWMTQTWKTTKKE